VKPFLEVKDLHVSYGSVKALKGVSLRVEEGSIVSLIGANGAGKSTLMKTLIGIIKSVSGDIRFKGTSILGKKSHEVVGLGISLSPEGRQVFPDMTVLENLLVGAYSAKLRKQQINTRIDEISQIFPILEERKFQLAGTLSGGEQQMLAIGRALMISPSLLLLDEPSLGVAPLVTEKIFQVLVELNRKGTSVLLAEQNAAMALEISNRGYVLELGEMIYEDASSELMANDLVRKAYLGV